MRRPVRVRGGLRFGMVRPRRERDDVEVRQHSTSTCDCEVRVAMQVVAGNLYNMYLDLCVETVSCINS